MSKITISSKIDPDLKYQFSQAASLFGMTPSEYLEMLVASEVKKLESIHINRDGGRPQSTSVDHDIPKSSSVDYGRPEYTSVYRSQNADIEDIEILEDDAEIAQNERQEELRKMIDMMKIELKIKD